MTPLSCLAKYRYELIFAGIVVLSGFLNFWNIWGQGITNDYYAAAVRSMMSNPALFFFNSFDPAGFVTVDKPPVGLWIQVISVLLFGFSGWALVLPQALAGIGSVILLYCIVSPRFGQPAGLVAAFTLAVTPIFVAVARNGTMDMQLIFVLLLAAWTALRAAKERSLAWLLVSVILVGIGFNIKMIQAYVIVPAILVVYLLGTRGISTSKKAVHILLSLVVLFCVSLSWAVVVDMVPAENRPYIGGSGDNTVLGLIINYNGIHRLENGMNGQGDGQPPGNFNYAGNWTRLTQLSAGSLPDDENASIPASQGGYGNSPGIPAISSSPVGEGNISAAGDQQPITGEFSYPGPGSPPRDDTLSFSHGADGMGGGMMGDIGDPGLFRLFTGSLAGQLSWLIPFALIGLLAWLRRPLAGLFRVSPDSGLSGERESTLVFMVLWLLPGLIYFSFTTGFWHPYYIATIAPPLAALTGIGAVAMYGAYIAKEKRGWLLVAAILVTGLVQAVILSYYTEWSGVLLPLLVGGIFIIGVILAVLKLRDGDLSAGFPKVIACAGVALLFIAPFIWACTPLSGNGNILPSAGPQISRGGGPMGLGGSPPGQEFIDAAPGRASPGGTAPGTMMDGTSRAEKLAYSNQGTRDVISGSNITGDWGYRNTSRGDTWSGAGRSTGMGFESASLAEYLISHNTGERWYVAVSSSHEATSLILDYGLPVMTLGGFSGTDQILTVAKLKEMVADGKIRYFLVSSSPQGGMNQGNDALFSWVRENSVVIPSSEWGVGVSSPDGDAATADMVTAGSPAMSGPVMSGQMTLYDCRPGS